MKRRPAYTVGFLAGVALLVTACGSATTDHRAAGTTSATATEGELIAWLDELCGVALRTTTALTRLAPQLDASDLATMQRQTADWFGANSLIVDESIKSMNALKDGPHPDSEKLVTAAVDAFSHLKASLDKAKAGIEATNPDDPSAFEAAVAQASADVVASAGVLEGFEGVLVDWRLADAEKKAPNCQYAATLPTPTTTT